MSRTIVIAIPPIPAKDKEAWEILDSLIEAPGSAPSVFRLMHDKLTEKYPCGSTLPDDELGKCVWSDGPIWRNFGHRAAVLGFNSRRAAKVLRFIVETARSLGFSVFDDSTGIIYRPDGFPGLRLTLESKPELPAPTIEQLHSAVDALTPDGGPAFLLLAGPGDDYTQAAGGNGSYTAEWREYASQSFRHWVAGSPNLSSSGEIQIPMNGGYHVTVKGNEALSADDIKKILASFAGGEVRPSSFAWRDNTSAYVS